jgi:acetylornithine deacetylase
MDLDPVELTREFVDIKSVSRWSNSKISDLVEDRMKACGLVVERLSYTDESGELKISLVGKKGEGKGGVGFFSHTDTVPGQEQDWDAYHGVVEDDKLYGRGSCDMKGPLACTLIAAASVDATQLKKPIVVVATADEEVGGGGAYQVTKESQILESIRPEVGVVAEPTSLIPVYSHKGAAHIVVTAHGEAAHTSTGLGQSANFLIAPFLAEMAILAQEIKHDDRFLNHEYQPPSNGFNMVITDYDTKQNVSAARSTCHICFRTMPNDQSETLVKELVQKAEDYGFEVSSNISYPYYLDPQNPVIQLASKLTGGKTPETVPYGTDAIHLKEKVDIVVLGPGSIAQAHTVGEYVEIPQLYEAVDIYTKMIHEVCL